MKAVGARVPRYDGLAHVTGRTQYVDDVREALSGHVCRCTGYVKILDAATAAVNGDVEPTDVEVDMGPRDPEEVTMIPGSPA